MKYHDEMQIKELLNDLYYIETSDKQYFYDCSKGKLAALPERLSHEILTHISHSYNFSVFTGDPLPFFSPSQFIDENKTTRLMIFLTPECNLRCIYCHCASKNLKHEYTNRAVHTTQKYLDQIEAKTIKPEKVQITFMGGGEPLLKYELMREIIAMVERYSSPRSIKTEFVIVTNSTLANNQVWDYLISKGFRITISADGPPSIQNYQRPAMNGMRTSEKVEDALQYLSQQGAKIHVRTTVLNSGNVAEICDYYTTFPCVATHSLEPVSIAGRALYSMHLADLLLDRHYERFFSNRSFGIDQHNA